MLCFRISMQCVALPQQNESMRFRSCSIPCVTMLCRYGANRVNAMPLLCWSSLCSALDMPDLASAIQRHSMPQLYILRFSATILCLSLRRGTVPMRSSSSHRQNNAQICSALACLCYTLPPPCYPNLCPDNAVRFTSNTLTYFAFAFFFLNLSALPPTMEPSSPISSHTNAPLPEFRHCPRPLYLP